jgi:microcystin-dependent protein
MAPADFVGDIGRLADALDQLQAAGLLGWNPGEIKMTGAQVAPAGWLLCHGQAVSRTVFSQLFQAIGISFGQGDGATTFNVPDYRDAFPMGAATPAALGARGGVASVALTVAQMPVHGHTFTGIPHSHGFSGGAHSHTGTTDYRHAVENPAYQAPIAPTWGNSAGIYSMNIAPAGGHWGAMGPHGWTGNSLGHSHGLAINAAAVSGTVQSATAGGTVGNAGSGQSIENRPPFVGTNFIIKT